MPLTITDYFRVMQQRDFLRDHQYRVSALTYETFTLGLDSLVYLKSAQVPSRKISTAQVPFMGLNFTVPGTAQYDGTIDLTFYCDQPQIIRTFFEGISYATFDDRQSSGAYTVNQANVLTFYTYSNVSTEIPTTQYTLVGIYPITVGALTMDTTGSGNVVNFTATLGYQFWEKSLIPVPGIPAAPGNIGPVAGVSVA